MPLAAFVIMKIRDTNYEIEDIQYVDGDKSQDRETVKPVHVEAASADA